ncbi:MAG: class I SAM-dependent methyltransferase [Myxococcales bacterium]|nr:class I SAM-dependent methyltransferase [Myxococcales bacterium]
MWNERYAEPGYAYGVEPNDFLVQQVGRLPAGGRVLELCAGEGRNGVWLAARGFAVTSVDGSAVGLAKASALAAERKTALRTVVSDLAAYDVAAEPWDVIVSIFAHLPPPLRQRVHAAAVQALTPGGIFLLEAYTPAQVARGTGGPRDPQLCMTLAGLRHELDGLSFLHGAELEREIHEGAHHHGTSSVVQVVAQKLS